MRVVYMGTPAASARILAQLIASGHEVELLVCKPDAPSGRGLHPTPPPTKLLAVEHDIPVSQPETMKDPAFRERLEGLKPELIVVVAYGRILPEWLISLPARGTVNVHFSLLPAYRGPAPVQRAIMNGDRMTGVTTQMVVYELDAGDVLLTEEVAIRDDDTTATLLQRLTEAGGPLLLATVEALATGAITRRQQDHAAATYAPMITKEETEIDWALSAAAVSARVRAFNPNPGAFTWLDGKRLKVWMALPAPSEAAGVADAEPGTVRIASDGSPLVACAEGAATLLDVQMAGRAHVTGAEFARGARLAGIRLGRTPPGLSGA